MDELESISGAEGSRNKMRERLKTCCLRPRSRLCFGFLPIGEGSGYHKLNVSVSRLLYINMHESAADLSMLKDFEEFKHQMEIVGRSFVTFKPIKKLVHLPDAELKSFVIFRDTALLAPLGLASLKAIGSIYGECFRKVDLGVYKKSDMKTLMREDPRLFEKYAVQDALITLKHANSMEEFFVSIGRSGVPLTLSAVGKHYVMGEWDKKSYRGYQVSSEFSLGNLSSCLTPKKVRSVEVLDYIAPFLASYRGGRNESLMFGSEKGGL